MKLNGRTILITGGSSGIGLELARQLLLKGNTVLITGRDGDKLERARRELPQVHGFVSDASDPEAIAALQREVAGRFPELDVVIANAGIMRKLRVTEYSGGLSDLTREIDVNLKGPIQLIQQFLPQLRARRPSAAVVTVSSGLAFVPLAMAPVYCATKAALHSYSLSLRRQLQGTAVEVFELAPPGTETPLYTGDFQEELKALKAPPPMPVAELARLGIAGIEAGRTEIRPGGSNALYFMNRFAPGFIFKQLNKIV